MNLQPIHPMNKAKQLVSDSGYSWKPIILMRDEKLVVIEKVPIPTQYQECWAVLNYPKSFVIGDNENTICFIATLLLVGFVESNNAHE